MQPGTGFRTPAQRELAGAYVDVVQYAHRRSNTLVDFLLEAGGQVRWSFKHEFTGVNTDQAEYQLSVTLSGEQEEREFPLDSVTALLHDLCAPLFQSRNDHLYLPEIANRVVDAIGCELEDRSISEEDRSRLIHLSAHASYLRQRFNAIMDSSTNVALVDEVNGPDDPRPEPEDYVSAGEALEGLFYCGAHPNPRPETPGTRRALTQRLGQLIRSGSPTGGMLLNSAVTALVQLLPIMRRLATVIEDWWGGQPHELPDLLHGDRDEYLRAATPAG